MNIFRRLPLYRLLLLCGVIVLAGVSATAIAFALDSGPTPPAEPLAQAVHDALGHAGETPIQGVSANITWTNHLLEGASLASSAGAGAGGLSASPLISGATGRLWADQDGHVRLELQSEQGDTEVLYDGHTLQLYDATSNTLYRYTPPAGSDQQQAPPPGNGHQVPSVAKIEEAIAHLSGHANVSAATPSNVAGQPAYTVRVSPKESGSLLGGLELSWDAGNGAPLRTAAYSSASSSPVVELAASEVSFGPVAGSVFAFRPPANAKVEEVHISHEGAGAPHSPGDSPGDGEKPKLTEHGHGVSTIVVLESKVNDGGEQGTEGALADLPKVTINGANASELRTELGTLLTFERAGVRYVVGGAVTPTAIEEVARGL